MKLKCDAIDCIYNSDTECDADVIRVGASRREAYCDTYTVRDTFSGDIYDLAHIPARQADAEFSLEMVDNTPKISCTASACAYNRAFRCMADGIRVSRPHERVCNCVTFRPK